jgi:adenylosuccinate lyase
MQDNPALTELLAITPVDGRYREDVAGLAECASEFALIRNRVRVEAEYLISLTGQVSAANLTDGEKQNLRDAYANLSHSDAQRIKDIELKGVSGINEGKKTDHDVKSVELFLRDRFRGSQLEDRLEFFHVFGDVANRPDHGLVRISHLDRICNGSLSLFLKTCRTAVPELERIVGGIGNRRGPPAAALPGDSFARRTFV